MSLINQMLADLDARSAAPGTALAVENICHDLRPVIDRDARTKQPGLRVLPVMILAAALGGALLWNEKSSHDTHDAAAPTVMQMLPVVTTQAPDIPVVTLMDAAESAPAAIAPVIAVADEFPSQLRTEKPAPEAVIAASPEPVPDLTPRTEPVIVVDKKMRVQTPEQKTENAYRMALEQYRNRQADRAEANLREILGVNPAHLAACELLAGIMHEAGRAAEAVQVLTDGLAQTPEHYAFASMLAGIYVELGQEPAALEALAAAQPYARGDAGYQGYLAVLYQRAGRHAEAIDSYHAALSLNMFESKWWLGLGISYEAVRDWAAAEDAYTRARSDGALGVALSRYAEDRLREIRGRKTASQ